MPALNIFGRRWYLGSDDLVYPCLLEFTIRLLWFVALMVVYLLQVDQNDCGDSYKIRLFYIGTMLFLVAYSVIDVTMATISARGSIMDVYPRRHVVSLLYLKFAVFLPEVAWTILGTCWMFTLSDDCGQLAIILAKAAVITEWMIIGFVLLFVFLMFDPLGRRPLKKRSLKDYKKMWYRRCRFMCCCLQRDENRADAFEEVATLFTLFFHGRDLVITDILAGIVLLSIKQRYERQINSNALTDYSEADTLRIRRCYRVDYSLMDHQFTNDSEAGRTKEGQGLSENTVNAGQENIFYVPSEKTRLCDGKDKAPPDYGTSSAEDRHSLRQPEAAPTLMRTGSATSSTSSWMSFDSELCPGFTPPPGPKPWMTLENAAYYLRYATAIYGSSNYAGCYNCSDRIPLCRKYRWCKNDPHLPADILQGDNYWECEAASVMLYSRLDRKDIIYADLDNQVFKTPYFVCRDDNKKTVVIAIRGTMSAGDALTDLTAQGEDIKVEHLPRGNVHKGIQKVAKKIMNHLENEIKLKTKIPQGYNLVITGHSLGAGVAAVLSLLIRDRYPEVICYAFSPPGGLVSSSLSLYLQDFVLTCFLGMDVVARLGVINMEKLKADLLAVIKNSKLPKYKILSSGLLSMCCGCFELSDDALLDDTQTLKLSGSIGSDWEHVVWIGDQETLTTTDNQPEEADGLSRQSSVAKAASTDEVGHGMKGSSARKIKDTEPDGRKEGISSRLSQGSFTSYDSRMSSYSSMSRYSLTSGKHQRNISDVDPAISDSHAKWRRKQKNKKVGLAATDPLYLPGQILYLYEDEEQATETCCNSEPVYKVRWARAEEFNSIQLHSKMMYHHNPYTVDEALQQILSQGQCFMTTAPAGDSLTRPYTRSPSSSVRSTDSGIRCDGLIDSVDAPKAAGQRDRTDGIRSTTETTPAVQRMAPPSEHPLEGVSQDVASSAETSTQVPIVSCKELKPEVHSCLVQQAPTNQTLEQKVDVDSCDSFDGKPSVPSRETDGELLVGYSDTPSAQAELATSTAVRPVAGTECCQVREVDERTEEGRIDLVESDGRVASGEADLEDDGRRMDVIPSALSAADTGHKTCLSDGSSPDTDNVVMTADTSLDQQIHHDTERQINSSQNNDYSVIYDEGQSLVTKPAAGANVATTTTATTPTTAAATTPTTVAATTPTTAAATTPTTVAATIPTTAAATTPTTAAATTSTITTATTAVTAEAIKPVFAATTLSPTTPATIPTTIPPTSPTTAPTTTSDTATTTTSITMPATAPTTTPDTAPTTTPDTAPTTAQATAPTTTSDTAPTTAQATAPTTTPDTAPTTAQATAPTTTSDTATTTTPTTAPTTAPATAPTTTSDTATTTTPNTAPTTTPAPAPTTAPTTAPDTATTTTPAPASTTAPTTIVSAVLPSTAVTTVTLPDTLSVTAGVDTPQQQHDINGSHSDSDQDELVYFTI